MGHSPQKYFQKKRNDLGESVRTDDQPEKKGESGPQTKLGGPSRVVLGEALCSVRLQRTD
jgi:hypothetical protein